MYTLKNSLIASAGLMLLAGVATGRSTGITFHTGRLPTIPDTQHQHANFRLRRQ